MCTMGLKFLNYNKLARLSLGILDQEEILKAVDLASYQKKRHIMYCLWVFYSREF